MDEFVDIWVCADCMLHHEVGEDGLAEGPEPWDLIESDASVAHVSNNFGEDDEGNQHGVREFSTYPCEGCGSHLGGFRYRYAAWLRQETLSVAFRKERSHTWSPPTKFAVEDEEGLDNYAREVPAGGQILIREGDEVEVWTRSQASGEWHRGDGA